MDNKLKIGDTVNWRGAWGTAPVKQVMVESITKVTNGKDGKPVTNVLWDDINGREYIVNLINGHWAWGQHISKI